MSTNQQDILDTIEREWRALLDLLAAVPLDAYERSRALGNWSIKDVVGHIATWEDEEMKIVEAYVQGQQLPSYGNGDQWNEQAVAQKRNIPVSIMLIQLGEKHQQLVTWLSALPAAVFQDPELERRIRIDTWEHYQQHRTDIERWLSTHGT